MTTIKKFLSGVIILMTAMLLCIVLMPRTIRAEEFSGGSDTESSTSGVSPVEVPSTVTATVNGSIRGKVGEALQDQQITITLDSGASFFGENGSLPIEIVNLPAELNQATDFSGNNMNTAHITVTGTPDSEYKSALSVGGLEIVYIHNNDGTAYPVKVDIVETATIEITAAETKPEPEPEPVVPSAAAQNTTIAGNVGSRISNQEIKVTLENGQFARRLTGSWIRNLPSGLEQTVTRDNDETATITISGTPREGSTRIATIVIPSGNIVGNNNSDITVTGTVRYAIEDNRPRYTATLSGTGSYASGGGQFAEGDRVSIYAGTRSGYTFNGWMASRTVTFDNYRNATTWFTMPAGNVTIYANWAATGTQTATTAATISSPGQANLVTVPRGLVNTRFNTVEAIQQELAGRIATSLAGYTRSNMIFLNVTPPAGVSISPNTYVTVTLNYPTGTSAATHDFAISHMLTSAFLNMNPGYVELISGSRIVHTAAGMRVRLQGLSPVAIAYKPKDMRIDDNGGRTLNVPSSGTSDTNTPGNTTAYDPVNKFSDVPADAFYRDALRWAVKKGITIGTSGTTFSPDAPCRREQMAVFLWRMADSPDVKGQMPFTDVKEGSYYYKAVLWAYQNGITKGTSKTAFSPKDGCTRGEMAAFLQRLSKEAYTAKDSGFEDVGNDAFYAASVAWLKKNGITTGTSGTKFSPDEFCRRSQMVTFLWKYDQRKK